MQALGLALDQACLLAEGEGTLEARVGVLALAAELVQLAELPVAGAEGVGLVQGGRPRERLGDELERIVQKTLALPQLAQAEQRVALQALDAGLGEVLERGPEDLL